METESLIEKESASLGRRSFLRYAGIGLAGVGILSAAACKKDGEYEGIDRGIDIGARNDISILNYAYALEQLEAAFYTQVTSSMYTGATSDEIALLTDIRDHELAHREFFKGALGANAIQALTPDFSSVNFGSRASVLATAQAFEDLGVSAYNGAGASIQSDVYLTIAGKIVSVEARHAAYIRNLVNPGSFADSTILDAAGMDKSKGVADVLKIANTFLKTKVNAYDYGYKS